MKSFLEIMTVATGARRVVFELDDHFEAPNWSRDGSFLIYNSHGRLYRLPVAGGTPVEIDTGQAIKCNNDHGLSPDGTLLAISDSSIGGQSQVYVLPAEGGTPRLVTEGSPSYWHGWSPDGKTLAYTGRRDDNYDIYTIPVAGGEETRLTTAPELDDGPDYTPDGEWIYFNSARTGIMRIWKVRPDGSEQTQVTFDEEYADWFPHPSPDGQHLVFLSYDKSVDGHPKNKDVVLRMMPLSGEESPRVIVELFGGQGTINVPSWSPDSAEFAFVRYEVET
ncbi:MAG: TolB protein [Candidatus Latescibacterota bacterium]|jgi:TolB protein